MKLIERGHLFLLTEAGAVHQNCDEPTPAIINWDALLEDGPKFETATPNERQISQHEIYKKS